MSMSNRPPGDFHGPSPAHSSAIIPATSGSASSSVQPTLPTMKRTANQAGLTDGKGAYRPPAFGDFGLYMSQKRHKLYAQDAATERSTTVGPDTAADDRPSQLFAGMSIHINGYVQEITQQELKDLILRHGGRYDHYLSKSGTTHIVASNLTEAKKVEFRRYKVASPKWILDSIQQGKLLPWHQYSVLAAAGTTLFDLGAAPVPAAPATLVSLPAPAAHSVATLHTTTSPTKSANARPSVLNAAADPDAFLTSYYQNSRLSFLSRWKAELQALTRPFQESRARNPPAAAPHRVILHVDMDSFFASVTLRDRPDLRTLPVAVSHSSVARDDSTAEIASCNYIARQFGLRNGMFVSQAKHLCPTLVLVPYAFDQYKATTEQVYTVLMDVADNLHAVSCDEAYVDVSSRVPAPVTPANVLALANTIRARIHDVTGGCTASVGAADCMLLARLATRAAKPNGAVWWTRDDFLRQRHAIAVTDMPGVGWKVGKRLKALGVETCLDVVTKVARERLVRELGKKSAQNLVDACEGMDARTFGHRARQTVSAEVNYGIRFKSVDEAHTFLTKLAHEVSQRLTHIGAQTAHLTLKLMIRSPHAPVEPRKFLGHGVCDSHSRSTALAAPTDNPQVIARQVITLLDAMGFPPADLRGIGISCTRLVGGQAEAPTPGQSGRKDGADLRQMFGHVANKQGKHELDVDVDGEEESASDWDEPMDLDGPGLEDLAPGGIDWSVFKDLPPDIQAELQQQWRHGDAPAPAKQEDRAHAAWKGKGKAKAGRDSKLTGHPVATVADEITDEQVEQALLQDVDASVLSALPPDIRAELIAEKRRDLESDAAARRVAMQLTPPAHTMAITLDSDSDKDDGPPRINNVLTPPMATPSAASSDPPSLLGRGDLPAIRALLRDWITHTAHHAAETDVDTDAEFVAQYAEALVDTGWMDRAKAVVQWLKYLVLGPAWQGGHKDGNAVVREVVARVEERVRKRVREVSNGGELVLDDW